MFSIDVNGKEISVRQKKTIAKGKEYSGYAATVLIGIDPYTRKKVYKDFYGTTPEKLKEKIVDVSSRKMYMNLTDITFIDYALRWFEMTEPARKIRTNRLYLRNIETHFKNFFGDHMASEMDYEVCQAYVNSMIAKGYSASTIQKDVFLLKMICDRAVSDRILFCNPCKQLKYPRIVREDNPILSEEEIAPFIKHCEGSKYRNAFAICLAGAFRRSELLGLSWKNVSFKDHTIKISQQLIDVTYKGQHHFGIVNYTKNGKSRIITLPDNAWKYLLDEKRRQTENKQKYGSRFLNPDGLVFTDRLGRPIKQTSFYNEFKSVAASFGRPELKIHDLRHTTATLLMKKTGDLYYVMEYLGHTHPSITLDYIETSPDAMKKLVNCIDECFDVIK